MAQAAQLNLDSLLLEKPETPGFFSKTGIMPGGLINLGSDANAFARIYPCASSAILSIIAGLQFTDGSFRRFACRHLFDHVECALRGNNTAVQMALPLLAAGEN